MARASISRSSFTRFHTPLSAQEVVEMSVRVGISALVLLSSARVELGIRLLVSEVIRQTACLARSY